MDPLTHFRRLFDYENRSNDAVLGSLLSARERLEEGEVAAEVAPFVRAMGIFAHVQSARRVWLSRLGHAEPPGDGLFPSWPLERIEAEAGALAPLWAGYLDRLTAEELDRLVSYRTTEGRACTTTVADILTHVVNHSSYHRGQIARLVAECGVTPAPTDFIFYARGGG